MRASDYAKLAQALEQTKPSTSDSWDRLNQWEEDCNAIADSLAFDDIGFDREQFLKDCDCI